MNVVLTTAIAADIHHISAIHVSARNVFFARRVSEGITVLKNQGTQLHTNALKIQTTLIVNMLIRGQQKLRMNSPQLDQISVLVILLNSHS